MTIYFNYYLVAQFIQNKRLPVIYDVAVMYLLGVGITPILQKMV